MRLALILLVLLAGCTDSLDRVELAVTGGHLDTSDVVSFDEEARPTRHLYAAQGIQHPDFYSLHDLLFEWAGQEGHDLETEFFDASFGTGFALCAIDDFPARTEDGQERGCYDRGGFWQIDVDGEQAPVGMSDLQVRDGQAIDVTWTTSE